MTAVEIKLIHRAISDITANGKVKKEDPQGKVLRITLPLEGRNKLIFKVYAFHRPESKKLYLSDGMAMVKELQTAGMMQFGLIQTLLSTYNLSLMEDLSVMDLTTRTLGKRLASFLQAWIAIDGMLRMWQATKENSHNVELPTAI
jgi:hypothetical protein